MPKRPVLQERLPNDRHEQFARCIGIGNELVTCAVGCGYDEEVAKALAGQKQIRLRAEEWFRRQKVQAWYKRGYTHPV